MSVKGTKIDGDVSIGRNILLGGRIQVQGSGYVKGNLQVDGWIVGHQDTSKGIYTTLANLKAEHPSPAPGCWALVSNGDGLFPASVYVVTTSNGVTSWVDSGRDIEAMPTNVELYETKLEEFNEAIDALETQLTESIAKQGIGTVDINQLGDLGTDDTLLKLRSGEITNIYKVTQGGLVSGLLVLTSSSAGDMTEWLFTRCPLNGGALQGNTVDTYNVYLHFRTWSNRNYEGLSDSWQKWQTIFSSSTLTDIDTKISEVNTALGADIEKLEAKVFPLEVEFTMDGQKVVEFTGETQTVNLSWKLTREGAAATPDTLNIEQRYGTIAQSSSPGKLASGSSAKTVNYLGTTTFTLTATIGSLLTATASITYQQVLPCYFGFAPEASASDFLIDDLTKQTARTSPNGTYTLNNKTTGWYLWLCVPSTMKVNKVTSSGFGVNMEAVQTGTIIVGSASRDYNCYRSVEQINQGDMTFTIS